ncbi:penicillin-binding protein 2 [Treponema ruminis]|uniref:Penicillin-binding protein 2 n=1 Tax=Treponema ruminis TaxID=744515 RepID=A0A7W8LLP6_9SPIR|nr:penicillin-binding protein 2 [Treponema ruminis]MBB5225558.1 penicillin-binding protein 2 [Treponema ruminis]QSI02246.1 penicillin-binding protein 2 [Treponema ruminis]
MQDYFNTENGSVEQNAKVVIFAFIIMAIFALYVLKLFSLQVIEGAQYRKQSQTISSQVKTIDAQRGEIFDRNASMPMVINTDSFAVDLTPAEIPAGHYDSVTSRLAVFLGISKNEIDRKIEPALRRSYTAVEVRSNVTFSTISNIAENITDLPGVSWRSKPVRNYVETGSISHVVGYVGDITKEEVKVMYNITDKDKRRVYTNKSIIGKTGVEKQYDLLLQGRQGRESRTVDVRGHILSDTPIVEPPQMGKNLVLTIDMRIQELAEKALGERVGAAVVLRPSNGEVLAMVSYPFYDQNLFNDDNASTQYNKLATSPNKPLLNRAVNAAYPPASTFKIIMSTAMLAEKAFSSAKDIDCSGRVDYGNRIFHCHQKWGHGKLNMKEALAQSCDVYYWIVGRDFLGVDKISSYAKEFGFGESLDIDLPAQQSGFVPTAPWKERRFHQKWLGGDTMNMSIGQGYTLVTPLHIANMVAMVANEGKIYRPHLLKEVRDPATNDVIEEVKPQILHESNIDEAVWREVQNAMRYTITDGTPAFPLNNKVVQIAGKTGTAEVGSLDHWHSWMACYAPFNAPVEEQVVVVVLVEAANEWEWWAPYATNIIFQGIFANQTYDEAVQALPANVRDVIRSRKHSSVRQE